MAYDTQGSGLAAQELLDAVLAAAPAPVLLLDGQAACLDILGAPSERMDQAQALKGRNLTGILDPKAGEALKEAIRAALATGDVATCVYCISSKDVGQDACDHGLAGTCWFEARIAPLASGRIDAPGEPAVACSCLDITELTKSLLLQEEQRLRLEEQSRLDELTGINNRGQILELARLEVARARRYAPKPLSLLRIDVDGLKDINAACGREIGDLVLATLGRALVDCCRVNDVVGRLDGGEFAVLLPETGIQGARLVGEKIRALAAAFEIAVHGRKVAVKLSVGVAALRQGENDLDLLLLRADNALHRAKASGRDKVCVFATGHEAMASGGP